ncbi:zinc finger protein 600-like [Episyrphus balteatus]|uniref:zinc finger protein 600-like n=1 Tax=Episyrphus balteatus TaxID=286459 RepID=UPI0024860AF3|nr:zinc finger protein 600-like [Episyrphus balteatus]
MSVKLDDTVCRVCLSSSGSITIFDDCGKDDQFRYCTSLEASIDDGLPSKLCKKCNDHLKVAYDFRFQAIYAEKYFRKTIFLPSFKKEDDAPNSNGDDVDANTNNHCSDELDENMAEIDMLLAIHTERVEDANDNYDDDNDNEVEMMDNSEFFDDESVTMDEKHVEIIGMETFEKEKREQKDQKVKLEIANVPPPLVSVTEGSTRFEMPSTSLPSMPLESPQSATSSTSVQQTHVSIEDIQQYTDSNSFNHHSQSVQEITINTGRSEHLEIHPVLKNDPSGFDFNVPTTVAAVGYESYSTSSQIQYQQIPVQIEYNQQHNTLPLQESDHHQNSTNYDFPYQETFSQYGTQTNEIVPQQTQQLTETIHQFQQPDQVQELTTENNFKTEYHEATIIAPKVKKTKTTLPSRKDRIECNICGSLFTHLNSLKTHLLKHSGEKPFKCEFCDKAFARKTVLNIHRRLHTGEKPYKCSLCPSAYVTKEALARHLQKDHVEEVGANFRRDKVSYICSICNKSRCSKYSLASHMKTHFNVSKVRRKIIRKRKEKTPTEGRDGVGSTEPVTQQKVLLKYSCKVCHKGFPNKWELCTHAETHNMHKIFECDVCQRTFEKKFQLLYHLQTHEGGEELVKAKVKPSAEQKIANEVPDEVKIEVKTEDQTPVVEKQTKRKLRASKRRKKKAKIDYEDENELSDVSEEKNSDHEKVTQISISKKGTTRAQRENLKVLRTSSKIECLICEAVFTHPTSLKTHMLVHSGERPFKCDHCDKSFARKTVLNIHRRLHTGEKPYKCPLCDSACVTKDALMRHMSKDHDDDREADRIKFTCGVCHKSMGTKYSLQTHMKLHEQNTTASSTELNFSCNMCTESFDTKSNYAKHMEVHDSHRNFQCDICQVTFEKKFKLLFHLQTHKIEDLPCKKCGETFTIRENLIQHVKAQHIDPQNMDFQCPTCNVGQYDTRDLKLHMLNVHEVTMGELNSCDMCGESHSTAAEYYKHMHDKHDTISKTCNECTKYFDSRKAFDKHILTHYM